MLSLKNFLSDYKNTQFFIVEYEYIGTEQNITIINNCEFYSSQIDLGWSGNNEK